MLTQQELSNISPKNQNPDCLLIQCTYDAAEHRLQQHHRNIILVVGGG